MKQERQHRYVDAERFLLEITKKAAMLYDPDGRPNGAAYADAFLNDAGNPSTEWSCVEDMVENLAEDDVRKAVRAKWEHDSMYRDQRGAEFPMCRCSACGTAYHAISIIVTEGNYCPACGAHMR